MTLLERLKTNDWRLEYFTIIFTIGFVLIFQLGAAYNKSKVNSFLNGVRGVFEENFFQFGVGNGKLFEKDSVESYASYATGRKNISKVNLVFRLAPRHNVILWIMETVLSYFTDAVLPPVDKVEIVVTPSADYENFTTAIVSKLGMNESRKLNYFLALTRTSDSPLLPESFAFMSEVNEFQEKTFTGKLAQSLKLNMASFLKFVAFTDQPADKPAAIRDLLPHRRVVISLDLVTGKKELAQISELLSAVFDVIDQIADNEITFKPEAARKVVKAREVEIAKIKKALEAAKQEEVAEELAKVRKQEKQKTRNLSREEQMKAEKKAQEKKARKAQKKMRVRN